MVSSRSGLVSGFLWLGVLGWGGEKRPRGRGGRGGGGLRGVGGGGGVGDAKSCRGDGLGSV